MRFLTQSLRMKTCITLSTIMYGFVLAITIFTALPQLVTGMIINFLLFFSASKFTRKESLIFSALPSIGVFAHGIMFGPQTLFLYYFLPVIWIGNYVLTETYRRSSSSRPMVRIILSSCSKYILLQLFSVFLVRVHIVPNIFLVSMGYVQLITALLGGILFLIVQKFYFHERTRNSH